MDHGGMPLSVILWFVCPVAVQELIMDPDDDIYLTQTVFPCMNDTLNTTYVGELADNILDLSESDLFNAENAKLVDAEINNNDIPQRERYEPVFSDILLYSKNFDEQLISETTGHMSVAVRSYKRTSSGQKKAISHGLRAMPSSSPSCTVTSASPSRTVTSASPSCTVTSASPSRTVTSASPSYTVTSASPSCTVTSPTYVNQDATSGFNVTFNI